MFYQKNKSLLVVLGALALVALACKAQDYDDEGYGPQNVGNQGDPDNYSGAGNGGADDGYSGNMPSYQQNVDSEGTNNSPSQYNPQAGGDADGDYEGDDGSAAAASSVQPAVVRVRRSVEGGESATAPKLRVKRHGKYYIGPVYTYVKTDKHANFKWGVKHKVGKKHYG